MLFDTSALQTAFLLAVLVNRLVAFFVTPIFERNHLDRFYLMYVSALVGFALTLFAGINLVPTLFTNTLVGQILTAIIVGGGANLLHDLTSGGTQLIELEAPTLTVTDGAGLMVQGSELASLPAGTRTTTLEAESINIQQGEIR
jgi:hypothetical protein